MNNQHQKQLYLNKNADLVNFLSSFYTGVLKFPMKYADRVVKEVLHPLQTYYNVEIPEDLSCRLLDVPMNPVVHLSEALDNFLLIVPKFQYDGLDIAIGERSDYYIKEGDSEKLLIRKTAQEESFLEYIRSKHPLFKQQSYLPHFTLPFEDVMRNNWFIDLSKELIAEGIKIFGLNELKRFKYNQSTPKWDMKVSSGLDWLDIKVTASWGDQVMSFKDIKKAIKNKQHFIVLGDGSFGVLPEEWVKKSTNLFKFAIDEKDGVKVNKKQFNIVEALFDRIDDAEVLAEAVFWAAGKLWRKRV